MKAITKKKSSVKKTKLIVKKVTKKVATKSATKATAKKSVKKTVNAGVDGLWQLRLYVNDQTPKSMTAFSNLKKFCETHLKGRYRIKVIDLMKHPQLAKGDQILAIPTVVRKLPNPVRTLIGTLSDTERVLVGLDLRQSK